MMSLFCHLGLRKDRSSGFRVECPDVSRWARLTLFLGGTVSVPQTSGPQASVLLALHRRPSCWLQGLGCGENTVLFETVVCRGENGHLASGPGVYGAHPACHGVTPDGQPCPL